MIETLDERLEAWAQEVLPGARVTLDGFGDAAADVSLHLLELRRTPAARGPDRPPLQVTVTYLVTAAADNAKLAHERLGALLFAALEHADFEVGTATLDGAFWLAAKATPRPGFLLSVPLRKPREQIVAKPVLEGLHVRTAPVLPLAGVVLGPRDVPISDALVEIPSLQLSTRSDHHGRFRFAAVPVVPAKQQIRVRAKAREFPFHIAGADRDEPVALRIDPTRG